MIYCATAFAIFVVVLLLVMSKRHPGPNLLPQRRTPEVGEIWGFVRTNDPWKPYEFAVKIVDLKPGWVRYANEELSGKRTFYKGEQYYHAMTQSGFLSIYTFMEKP